ncbi:MAG: lytic transglycosylase domain-containing protein [Alphaproteobacteria bacterium]|nr:lytic transglycosylase domain-containing protein [Alphaproteobacteria bacterium]
MAALFFWVLGATETSLDAATPIDGAAALSPLSATHAAMQQTRLTPQENGENAAAHVEAAQILSPRDAALYRAAFTAQEISDWKLADTALAQVSNKILIGSVLADRYLHGPMTLDEAKAWMAAYKNQPEATAVYNRARHLRGFARSGMTRPAATAAIGATTVNDGLIDTGIEFHPLSTDATHISRAAADLFYKGKTDKARALAHAAAEKGTPQGLWIDGLAAWKQQDYNTATRSFASLAQAQGLSDWDRAAAAFWAYRGAQRLHDHAQARHWLAEAAKYPHSFYGFMAADLSNRHPDMTWKAPAFDNAQAEILARYPAGRRAMALIQAGRGDLAEDEIRHMNMTGRRALQQAALALAESAHMPSLALQLSGVATDNHGHPYDAAMYPVPSWRPADGFKVDRALLFALMKRESQFDPAAVSGSGACGLMQIMPATARQMTNGDINARRCSARLFDPATNMKLGQRYVRVLAAHPMIGDNLLLLLAAYNGGPGNVAHWIDVTGTDIAGRKSDPLLFIESLPARQTRAYVQQVLLHYWMYRARLSEPEHSVAQLARGEWPRYSLASEEASAAPGLSSFKMASATAE